MLPQRLIERTAGAPLFAFALGVLSLGSSAAPSQGTSLASDSDWVALRAGTIHCVRNGQVFEGGATILIHEGKIVSVGKDLKLPPNVEVVDYGPDAVVVPGLVAPYSNFGSGQPARRSASPGTRAVDNFNPFFAYAHGLAAGVTSAYITPGESRLISGLGAVVKLGAGSPESRVINPQAAIHCSVDELSRNAPGYWDPPLPVNAEQELGYAKPQLPATAMGAIVALTELLDAARHVDKLDAAVEHYGAYAIRDLVPLLDAGVPWRISAVTENEIRAALRFAKQNKVPLVLEKVNAGKLLAQEIAEAGVAVVYRVPFTPNRGSSDKGTEPDDMWPEFDIPAALVEAGVRVAIASSDPADLLFSAALSMRGGLSAEAALRAITLTPAQLSGVSDRVGSIRAGKDADLCVLNAAPLSGYASVLATWVDGKLSWQPSGSASRATVLEVEELHVGDGEVLRPGQLLIQDGRIAEVAERVSHPVGARVVRAEAAMPGMIDAFGHLGLEGSKANPATDFDMTSILSPGDAVDRRVASHGITTVVMTPRSATRDGAPVIAYKPAATEIDQQVVDGLAAVRLNWGEANPQGVGDGVKALLAKAKEYETSWEEYRKALSQWTPSKPEVKEEKPEETKEEQEGEEESEEKDAKPAKKKKKDEEEVIDPDPITGRWVATIIDPAAEEAAAEKAKEDAKKKSKKKQDEKDEAEPGDEAEPEVEPESFKMRLYFEALEGSGKVTGNIRCPQVSMDLVQVVGQWDREAKTLKLNGLGSKGWVTLAADYKQKKFKGSIQGSGLEFFFRAERTSAEHVVADRPERRRPEMESTKDPKDKPKEPRLDTKLEPYLRAMQGELAVVVDVYREDAILDCVATFEQYGIKPVLFGATDAHYVAEQLVGRVAGVLLDGRIRRYEPDSGIAYTTPYSNLQSLGIPVAFHSGAEAGAVDLPIIAIYAVANGMSPAGALRALTSDAAAMMFIDDRVGSLRRGMDADILLLDGPPLAPGTSVLRTWVGGEEIH